MPRTRGGDKRSSWLIYQRRLCIIRQLIRAPLDAESLIAAARAAFDDEIYPLDAAAALRHDIAALRVEFGCVITFQRASGYVLEHPGRLAVLDLPDEELEALAFLRNQVAASSLPNAAHVRGLLDRITLLLPEERRAQLGEDTPPRLDNPRPLRGADPVALRRLIQALGRSEVDFQYYSPLNDGPTYHRVAPYELSFRDGNTYLEAFCLECVDETVPLEQSYVFYRLDRVIPGTLRRLPRVLPPGRPPRRVYRLRYRLAPEIARRQDFALWFAESRVTFESDGSALVEAQTSDLWLARQILLRYREFCQVLEPPELVRTMRETLARIIALYEPSQAREVS